jgi:hypothetical protein
LDGIDKEGNEVLSEDGEEGYDDEDDYDDEEEGEELNEE